MKPLTTEQILSLVGSYSYMASGSFVAYAQGGHMVPAWAKVEVVKPAFACGQDCEGAQTFVAPSGVRWYIYADADEFAMTSAVWAWQVRSIPKVNYAKILDTLGFTRIFLGYAFQNEEKSWIVLVASGMLRQVQAKVTPMRIKTSVEEETK